MFAAVAASPAKVPDHLLLLAAEALHAILTAQPAAAALLIAEAQLHPLVDALALELRQALNTHVDLTLACALGDTLTAVAACHSASESEAGQAQPWLFQVEPSEVSDGWTALATHLTLTGSMERLSGLCASITDHEALQLRTSMLPLLKLMVTLARQ